VPSSVYCVSHKRLTGIPEVCVSLLSSSQEIAISPAGEGMYELRILCSDLQGERGSVAICGLWGVVVLNLKFPQEIAISPAGNH
jgi:hypothetical protein